MTSALKSEIAVGCIFFTIFACLPQTTASLEPFECGNVSVCNAQGIGDQFCSNEAEPRCVLCMDLEKSCFTTAMPFNCTHHCLKVRDENRDRQHKENIIYDLRKILGANKTCKQGSKLTYFCDIHLTATSLEEIRTSNHSWISLKCRENEEKLLNCKDPSWWKIVLITIGALLLGIFIGVIGHIIYSRIQNNSADTERSNTASYSSLNSESNGYDNKNKSDHSLVKIPGEQGPGDPLLPGNKPEKFPMEQEHDVLPKQEGILDTEDNGNKHVVTRNQDEIQPVDKTNTDDTEAKQHLIDSGTSNFSIQATDDHSERNRSNTRVCQPTSGQHEGTIAFFNARVAFENIDSDTRIDTPTQSSGGNTHGYVCQPRRDQHSEIVALNNKAAGDLNGETATKGPVELESYFVQSDDTTQHGKIALPKSTPHIDDYKGLTNKTYKHTQPNDTRKERKMLLKTNIPDMDDIREEH